MSVLSPEQRQLAAAYGVATEYVDWRGRHVEVSAETITMVLAAMEVDGSSPAAATESLRTAEEGRWARMLPPCVVVRQGSAQAFWVHVPHGDPVAVWVELETGARRTDVRQLDWWVEPRSIGDGLVGEATFELPADLPLGYHTVGARSGSVEARTTLVVTPSRLTLPERLGSRRAWGFATQLYSVRSRQSWGVGDLVDLMDLAVWSAAELGAGYLLVNPLHAAEPVPPLEPSPYLPTSRRFVNPMYLRVERVPEYAGLSPSERERMDALSQDVHSALDQRDVIDRDASWAAKREALTLVHGVARAARRDADYLAFRRREGEGLVDFAVWSAIAEEHGNDFRRWPEAFHDPSSPWVAAFRETHEDEIGFHIWLQWVTNEQLQTAQAKAVGAGMPIGIMHDLAVGVHPGGADAWRLRTAYALGVQAGAPPDPYNQMGQAWSQPPWRPDRLAESGYLPFRELLASQFRHAGGLRVDHIIGLFRLWWIPASQPPSEGTYVRYDHEALIGILGLEANRAGAVVIGEDLGVVEPATRDYLRARGILGTSILWFETDEHGRPLPAERWREDCLASVTTHDLPPTAAYLEAGHVLLREQLGLLTRPVEEELAAAEAERAGWLAELQSRGVLAQEASVEETVWALHRYLTLTPARLLCVSLADAVGELRAQNQPGTTNEYPNWRIALTGSNGEPVLLEDVMRSPRVRALAQAVGDGPR